MPTRRAAAAPLHNASAPFPEPVFTLATTGVSEVDSPAAAAAAASTARALARRRFPHPPKRPCAASVASVAAAAAPPGRGTTVATVDGAGSTNTGGCRGGADNGKNDKDDDDDDDDDGRALVAALMGSADTPPPSDAEVAAAYLRAQFPYAAHGLDARTPPLCLRSQVLALLAGARSVAVAAVDGLVSSGLLRPIVLPGGTPPDGDVALVYHRDYLAAVEAVAAAAATVRSRPRRAGSGGGGVAAAAAAITATADDAARIRAFGTRVVPATAGRVGVGTAELARLLGGGGGVPALRFAAGVARPPRRRRRRRRPRAGSSSDSGIEGGGGGHSGGDATAAANATIDALIRGGLLLSAGSDADAYMFALPGQGRVVSWLATARAEVLAALRRAPYGEVAMADITERSLRRSPLSALFIVRDLVGAARLEVVDVGGGGRRRLRLPRQI